MIENPQSQPTPLEVSDFSGGITDNFINGRKNQARELENFLLTDNAKPITRPGTLIYDSANPQLPIGTQRISGFLTTDNNFLQAAGRRFFSQASGSWEELTGPENNPLLATGNNLTQFDSAQWNDHYLVTGTDYGNPMKVLRGETPSDYKVVNAGLPEITLYNSIALANELKAQFNDHLADPIVHTGPGGPDTDNTVTSIDSSDLSSLLILTNELSEKYIAHHADALLVAPDHHVATGTDFSLDATTAVVTLLEARTRLDDLKTKFNSHDSDAVAHSTSGTHQVGAGFVTEPQITGVAGSENFIYTLLFFYEYKVGTVTYRDFGPTHQILVENVDAPQNNDITIANIPELINGATQNYDVTNVDVYIYRTSSDGTVSYFLASLDNGGAASKLNPALYFDSVSDLDLVADGDTLYTTGGISDNDAPPEAKYVTVVNDIAWYANIKEGGETLNNVVQQSIKFDIDSCPAEFRAVLADEVVGMGAVNIYPIVFCRNKIYRLEGFISADGSGGITQREISRTVGCISHNSIRNVKVPDRGEEGIVFASDDGFYFTDGFNIQKISDDFDIRYSNMVQTDTQQRYIYGAYDGLNDRVYWATARNSINTDNDGFFVFDADWGIKKDATFTTLKPAKDSWVPTAIAFDHNGDLVIGDKRGYAFKFDKNTLTDPKINQSVAPANWLTSALKFDYQSVSMNGGTGATRKWLNLLTVTMENRTNISLLPSYAVDNSNRYRDIKEIRHRGGITWGDPSVIWQDATPDQTPPYLWNDFPDIQQKRRFPAGKLRVNYITIRFTNSETIITTSDNTDTAGVSGNTVTLDSGSWQLDAADYKISFEDDGYVTEHSISAVSGADITVTGTPPAGAAKKWHLVGVAKNEAFNLIDYAVHWQQLTPSFVPYRPSSSGANA